MKRFICCMFALALLASCKSPPPPPPRPQGILVPWPPKPPPRKVVKTVKPGEIATPEEREPSIPPDVARPHDDAPNPGEIIQQSEQAKENATDYVLKPNAQPHVIDQLTILTRNVRRARNAMEQQRLPDGRYDPDKIDALKAATDALESYQTNPGH